MLVAVAVVVVEHLLLDQQHQQILDQDFCVAEDCYLL